MDVVEGAVSLLPVALCFRRLSVAESFEVGLALAQVPTLLERDVSCRVACAKLSVFTRTPSGNGLHFECLLQQFMCMLQICHMEHCAVRVGAKVEFQLDVDHMLHLESMLLALVSDLLLRDIWVQLQEDDAWRRFLFLRLATATLGR